MNLLLNNRELWLLSSNHLLRTICRRLKQLFHGLSQSIVNACVCYAIVFIEHNVCIRNLCATIGFGSHNMIKDRNKLVDYNIEPKRIFCRLLIYLCTLNVDQRLSTLLKYPRQIASDDEWTRTLCMHVANDPFPFLIIYRA